MSDRATLEPEVRRMLERRAGDIDNLAEWSIGSEPGRTPATTAVGTPSAGRSTRLRPLVAAAVAVLVLAGGTAIGAGDTVSRIATDVIGEDSETAADTDDDGTAETTDNTGSDTPSDDTGDSTEPTADWTYDSALTSSLSSLPPGFDPASSPPLFSGDPTGDSGRLVENYLAARWGLPDPTVEQIGAAAELSVHRWSADDSSGFVIVRAGDMVSDVVATTTDGVAVTSADRTIEQLAIDVEGDLSGSTEARFSEVRGDVIGVFSSPEWSGQTVAIRPGPVPVTVRLVDRDPRIMVEFGVDPVGFADVCGTEAPIVIDVGDMAGALEGGPIIDDLAGPITNQRVWHHGAIGPDRANLEIRWPADPGLVAGFVVSGDRTSGNIEDDHHGRPATTVARSHALIGIDRPSDDPCAVVQVTVDGGVEVADWWASALAAEWHFGEPLSIAQLDPDTIVDDPGDSPSGGEVIAGSMEAAALPVIPDTGSCDGLPDAPPQTGPGLAEPQPDPETALAAFLDQGPHGDPPLTESGYTEVSVGGAVAGYAVLDEQGVYTVIELEETPDGWTVIGWTGSAC